MRALIFDCDNNRGTKLERGIFNYTIDSIHQPHVWDIAKTEGGKFPPDLSDVKPHFWEVEPDDIVFIHHNDNLQYYWGEFVEEKCNENFILFYSGGGITDEEIINVDNFFFIQPAFRELNDSQLDFPSFFRAVKTGARNPFGALTKKKNNHEEKLSVLHHCLTPEGAKLVRQEKMLEKIELHSEINFETQMISVSWKETAGDKKEKKSMTIEQAVGTLSETKDCFSEKYINILSGMRDLLLTGAPA